VAKLLGMLFLLLDSSLIVLVLFVTMVLTI